jgi:hypothetical protein
MNYLKYETTSPSNESQYPTICYYKSLGLQYYLRIFRAKHYIRIEEIVMDYGMESTLDQITKEEFEDFYEQCIKELDHKVYKKDDEII